jgi:protein-S-isoprenylcysteine O-methyltransferase Ste14
MAESGTTVEQRRDAGADLSGRAASGRLRSGADAQERRAGDRLGAARASAVSLTRRIGPPSYSALFVLVLPLALALWAANARGFDGLPRLQSWPAGALLVLAGLALWAAGVWGIVRHGGGLPMNAYPPPRYVSRGAYGWVRHPIYCGFVGVAAGLVLITGSRAGLWLVLPVLALAVASLVVGYETPALRARFGRVLPSPRLALPRPSLVGATPWDRLSVYVLVLLPWLLTWSIVQLLGVPPDAFSSELALDRRIPVLESTWLVYATAYLLVPLVPLLLGSRYELRRFATTGLWATFIVLLLWLTLPLAYTPRPFEPAGFVGRLLELDRRWCTGMAAFPSFHALWALIAADALTRRWARARWWLWGWAGAVTLSCLTTGMHGVLDLIAALALFPLVRDCRAEWSRMRRVTERVANSWHEWRLGPVRVISHGLWAGLAGGAGAASLLLLGAHEPRAAVLGVAFGGLLGAGVWAQVLESSSGLLRPFGYYGAVFGALAVALAGPALGFDGLLLLSAAAVGAPWVQLLGRIRCLIQGCCHGHVTSPRIGIRYTHPRSRVSYLAGLAGEPLHPTPLYSMAANAITGIVLARLWWLGAPQALIVGVYLIANGLARFVEEGFRGEPQTPILGGLRLYQWLAIAFVLGGAAVTTLPSPAAPAVAVVTDWTIYLWIGVFGLTTGAALGVDFPASNRRFSRLAGG